MNKNSVLKTGRKTRQFLSDSKTSKVLKAAGLIASLLPAGRAGRTAKAASTVLRVVIIGSAIARLARSR